MTSELLEWEELEFLERLFIKEKSEKSFLNFTRLWFELIQGEKLLVNWHHRYIAQEVDKVVRGGNHSTNLAISIPPGGTKTEFMSIHLPAYTNMLVQTGVLTRFRNLNLSFADSLVKRNSRRTRDIIASPEYQELWPCGFGVNQAEEWQILTDKGKVTGETVSRAMGGQITGGRGGYFGDSFSGSVNMDDPMKPEDAFSMVKRDALNRKLNNTVRSRRGDKSKEHPTPFFMIMQRLHVNDPIGFALKGELGVPFKPLVIPALINNDFLDSLDPDIRKTCWDTIKDTDSRVIGGDRYWSYWPQMEHIDQLVDLWERDEYTFLSQYMQKPTMMSGGLIETDWFGRYTQLPFLTWAAIYVDTNSGKVADHLDYTVFTLCAMGDDGNMYILDISRGRWDPTDLLQEAEDLWDRWRSMIPATQHLVIRAMNIEDKQAGQGLITTLTKRKQIPVVSVPRGNGQNKYVRHSNCQPQMKMGKVLVPALHNDEGEKITKTTWFNGDPCCSTDWVTPFLSECDLVTVGVLMDTEKGFDDQYDTVMDAIDDMLINEGSSSSMSMMFG